MNKPLSVALVVPYGSDAGSYFSETLFARMVEEARLLGHRATLVRVYYELKGGARDVAIGDRLEAWLDAHDVDVVAVARLFDPLPICAHRAKSERRRVVLVAEGESPPSLEGIDFVMFDDPGRASIARGDNAPAGLFLDVWERVLGLLARGERVVPFPGLSVVEDGRAVRGGPLTETGPRRAFRATVEAEVIASRPVPPLRNRTLNGTYGCPYSADPLKTSHFAGVKLPTERPIARLGCSFCPMGGDYIAGTDESIVQELLEQAGFWLAHDASVEELVLSDQHPIRYLAALMEGAEQASMRPVVWLFAARADAFVRERAALEAAVRAAKAAGQRLEVYLTGFESFSEAELLRYNKGVDVAQELAAVDAMRDLKRRYPGVFEYGRSRGHSLILWNPWTEPSDVRASVDTIRAHGLRDLFNDLGRNRLRLHPNIPIFHAALRDGLVADRWDEAGEGTARELGYGAEQPWRFRDARTRRAYVVSRALLRELGPASELAQLAAVTEFATRDDVETRPGPSDDEVSARVLDSVRALVRTLHELALQSRAGGSSTHRAHVVMFAGPCNNGCVSCSNADSYLDDGLDAIRARIDEAPPGARALVLAGREPSIHAEFTALVGHAHAGSRDVGIVTNGRRFAYASFARTAARAGLAAASVKLFGFDAATADTHTRVAGAHAQALAGFTNLVRAGLVTEARIVLHRGALTEAERVVDVAASVGASQLCLDVALDALSLDAMDRAPEAVHRIVERARQLGLPLRGNPLGHPGFEAMPARVTKPRAR